MRFFLKKNTQKIPKYLKIVSGSYDFKSSRNLKGLDVKGPWRDNIVEFIKEHEIEALYLWRQDNYSFLSKLDGILELDITTSEAAGLTHIEGMTNLRNLSITAHTADIIDFSKLKNLSKCYLLWWKGADSILDVVWLKNLYLDERKAKDFSRLANFFQLESLTLANTPIENLDWVQNIKTLRELELYNCKKLSDFQPIKTSRNLTKLCIDGSKLLSNIDFVENLTELEILNISDNGSIKSLSPLRNLKNLKALACAGKTLVSDGDLSILETLPKLSRRMFQPHNHYSHKLIQEWDWKNFDTPAKLLEKKLSY